MRTCARGNSANTRRSCAAYRPRGKTWYGLRRSSKSACAATKSVRLADARTRASMNQLSSCLSMLYALARRVTGSRSSTISFMAGL